EAIVQKDYKNAFDYAHTLKGVAGNMGLSPIYKAICDIVEPLRRNDYSNLQYLYAEIIENYNKLQAYRVEEKRYEC
ncbi:MAG: Hpt domain-containing protein, partial [Lachnospiraceae bacterium]